MTADSVSFINEHFVCAATDGQNTHIYIYIYIYIYITCIYVCVCLLYE